MLNTVCNSYYESWFIPYDFNEISYRIEIGFNDIGDIKVKSVTNIRKVSPTSVANIRSSTYLWYDIKFSWSFKHDDLKKAVLSLLVNDDLQSDEYVITMVRLIKEQFENEHEMFDWTKQIFEKVRISLNITNVTFRMW